MSHANSVLQIWMYLWCSKEDAIHVGGGICFDFLMGLDDTYSSVHSQILSVDPLLNLGRDYAITTKEEKQRSITTNHISTIEATTLLTKVVESR